jgi:hypothetical protein
LRLPSELRIEIYEHVLGRQEVIIRKKWTPRNPLISRLIIYTGPLDHVETTNLDLFSNEDTTQLLALHRTCRSIFHETIGMWFARNTFQGRSDAISAFVKHPNTQTHHIRIVRLRFNAVVPKDATPADPISLTAEPKNVMVALRPLKRLKTISVVLPNSELPAAHIKNAIIAEMRRVFEQDREGTHVQIVMQSFGERDEVQTTTDRPTD